MAVTKGILLSGVGTVWRSGQKCSSWPFLSQKVHEDFERSTNFFCEPWENLCKCFGAGVVPPVGIGEFSSDVARRKIQNVYQSGTIYIQTKRREQQKVFIEGQEYIIRRSSPGPFE